MSGGLRKVLKCLSVTFMLIGYSSSQFSTPNGVDPTTYDPCFVTNQLVQEPRSGDRSFSDNLVCPGTSLCFPQEELCNGVNNQDCTGGADEGVNIVSLDCDGTLSQAEENVFVCTPGDNIPIVELCDGINDCQNGDDETTALCANKCLGPYAGGCNDLNRVCISSPFDVNCGDCFVGFEPNPASPANPPPCVETQVIIGFEFPLYDVLEGNQQVVCLVINAAPLNDVAIQVTSIQSGAAIAGLDFVPINAGDEIVTFPASSIQPQCIFVQTIPDDIAEVEECFTLGAALLNGFATVNPGQTTVCIQDDDFIQYEIDAPAIVTEGTDTFAEVCVRLIVGQLAQPTQVDLTIQQGTAFDGEDFSSAIATTVVFPAGTFPGGIGSEQCINIPIINDQRVELTESFSVSAGPAGLDFPSGNTAIITVLDDDVAIYQFTQITYQNSEGNNLAAAIELISGILTFDMDIQVVTNDFIGLNAADENDDYDPLTQIFPNQVILTFPAGSSPITQQPLEVELFDDNLAESTESFQLSAFSNSNQAGFTQDRDVATGLILDNDVCQIGFEEPSYTTEEGNAQEVCLIKLNNVQLGGPLTVNVQTTAIGSTKTEGQDYNQFNGQVIFGQFSFRECVTIQTLDDNIDEPTECVQINAVPANNAQSIQILQSQTEVCCLDNDDNTFQFVDIVIDVPEQGPQAQCCIELVEGLLGGQVIIQVDVEPTVPVVSAQVGLGLDVSPNVAMLFFPAGTMPNTPQAIQCFPTTVLNDNQVEDTESYLLVASSNSQGVLFTPGRAVKTVNIIEDPNDNIPICLEPPTVDTVLEDVGSHQECVEITGLQNRLEKIVSLTLSTSNGPAVETDAQDPMDYIGGNQVIFFDPNNQNGVICVDIPIVDDTICENDESFTVSLMSNDPCVTINQFVCTGTVIIADNDVATVQSTQPSYSVNEGETVHIDFQLIGQKGPGRECVVTVTTMDGTALSTVAWRDYFALPPTTLVFDSTNTLESIYINVCDDSKCEGDEEFEVILSTNSNGCAVGGVYTVTIIDDEVDTHGMGDDPHFSIALPSGELLCYTVQGEHDFSFNLISNHKMAMNAKFVPDARREEVTWLGSIGIIVKNTNYKGSNETKLRFDVDTKSIYIGDKVQLEARNIEKLTFSNGKLTISEAPPKQGFHYPSVYVDLEDVQLQFTIKYTNQHLDIYWHSTGGRLADSHGLIGQFFRKGVEIDEVRKILIMPNKEPIPVMRRPVWSFMERENPDEQLCWTAMNSGYQGEGLIDGTYFDYLVDDVLSTDFKFEKQ